MWQNDACGYFRFCIHKKLIKNQINYSIFINIHKNCNPPKKKTTNKIKNKKPVRIIRTMLKDEK